MPRRPRIHLAGVPLHIIQRGHNREACCCGCALHAYVLMTNHVHFRFLDTIERVTGQRRKAKPRGRPRVERTKGEGPDGQVQIELK